MWTSADPVSILQTFEINNHTGHQLEEDELQEAHCRRLYDLQLLCFQQWPQLRPLALSHVGAIERRDQLAKFLAVLSDEELRTLVTEHVSARWRSALRALSLMGLRAHEWVRIDLLSVEKQTRQLWNLAIQRGCLLRQNVIAQA